MQLGVNVPNFGPGTDPGVLREWARVTEGLGFDLLMVSDHVAVTPDVAQRYPEPFYEPFTTLSWLAGLTTRLRLGTTVLIVPYRPPLLAARMATNLNQLSGGRLVLGAGVGTVEQVLGDLDELRQLGAETVVLDPYHGDPEETRRPQTAWRALTAVATLWRNRL
ncbi:LLM class flavin-dependent oxidoreductase [Promicromonospora aerolata]|uniref:LLM class flavin-dependent oxidoreductase n=1 Tax=Promicromonospora aerolata TaxID=195749 RepID=A0ABW4VD62_9MICO